MHAYRFKQCVSVAHNFGKLPFPDWIPCHSEWAEKIIVCKFKNAKFFGDVCHCKPKGGLSSGTPPCWGNTAWLVQKGLTLRTLECSMSTGIFVLQDIAVPTSGTTLTRRASGAPVWPQLQYIVFIFVQSSLVSREDGLRAPQQLQHKNWDRHQVLFSHQLEQLRA